MKFLENGEEPRSTLTTPSSPLIAARIPMAGMVPPPYIGCCTPMQPLFIGALPYRPPISDLKERDREKADAQVNQGEEPVAVQKDSLLPPIPAASTSTQTFNSRYQFHPPVPTDTDVVTPTSTPQPTLNPSQP